MARIFIFILLLALAAGFLVFSESPTRAMAADYPGDKDIALYPGPDAKGVTGDDPIWTLEAGGVHSGSGSGPLILLVYDLGIYDSDGNLLCKRRGDSLYQFHPLTGSHSRVLFTVPGSYVFVGEPRTGDRPAFAFRGKHVFAGDPDRPVITGSLNNALLTASEHIQFASPMRKLVIAALTAGECGSPGLPDS